jgi:hypothetical protein
MWCIPPAAFFSKKALIGLFSPRGCKSFSIEDILNKIA